MTRPAPRPRRATLAGAVAVGAGSVLGAGLRWALAALLDAHPGGWPWPTFAANVAGCALIGALGVGLAPRPGRPAAVARRPGGSAGRSTLAGWFAMTGVCGGLTTMSGFALELAERFSTRPALAVGYLGATLIAGFAAFAAGRFAAGRRTLGERT